MTRQKGYTARELVAVLAVVLLIAIVLPAVRTSLGVGSANLEIVFNVADDDGRPLSDALISLTEIREDAKVKVQTLNLRTDEQGEVRHDFGTVDFTNATDLFGREVDLEYAIPWWEIGVSKRGRRELAPLPLPVYCGQQHVSPLRISNGQARLVVPVRLRIAD